MTTLVRFREPLRNVAMNAEFERLINTVLDSPARSARAWAPPLDVWETEGELVYAFDMPGIPEDKITVEIEDNTLTVSGSRERAENVEDERFFRSERRFGDFTRSVALPGPMSPAHGSRNTSSRAAISPPFPKSPPRSRRPAFWSATSKSCGCIMRRR